jgi:two-component system phosphate regulon response regulator OmpR
MAAAEVLVVEDDQAIRETLTQFLREEGSIVHEAPNGTLALERLQTHPARLVVMLDILMPVMGGFAVLQAVAQNPALLTRHAYILMAATQRTPPPDVAALIEQHAIPYLLKPFDLDDVLAAVQKAARTLQ